jgi:hypothetical protein
LLHNVPNKQIKTICIILVLVDVVKEPIEQLTFLCLSAAKTTAVISLFVPKIFFFHVTTAANLCFIHQGTKQTEPICIILVLVDVVREPIEQLTFLCLSAAKTAALISFAVSKTFISCHNGN